MMYSKPRGCLLWSNVSYGMKKGCLAVSGHLGFPRLFLQEFMNERLVGFVTLCCETAKSGKKLGRDANRD
jgi:hypothetical protein